MTRLRQDGAIGDTATAPTIDATPAATGTSGLSNEELASAFTSGAGAIAALLGGVVLVARAVPGDGWQLLGAVSFSLGLALLYLASTLYHAAGNPRVKARLKVFDHCAIYLLIAGTYTPFTLIALRSNVGWWLFATIWSLALSGIVFKLFFTGRFKLLSTLIYVAMGWLGVLAIKPVMAALDGWTFGWMLAGGVAYTVGTAFYLQRTLRYSHAVWHLFVIAGSACHYVAVLALVSSPR
jgi:hemolysin III